MPTLDPRIEALRERLVAWRRDFHRHPEPGYAERRSQALIEAELVRLGFEVSRAAETGLVALWRGADPACGCVALRADMDALPMQELNETDYASEVPGMMHACGHDAHMAMLLGVAHWLAARGPARASVKLLFQPAEEGLGGAQRMIADGALNTPDVDEIYGLHVWSPLASGVVGTRAGALMASSDRFAITFIGRGGHGAMPQEAKDALLAAAAFAQAAQALVARETDPQEAAVVSICQFHAGEVDNVIPERAVLRGTTRAFNAATRARLKTRMREMARGIAATYCMDVDFAWTDQYPPTINDARAAARVRVAACELFGEARVCEIAPTSAAEDMSYYLERVPGCHIFLGSRNEAKGSDKPHHNPRFDIDEDVLPLGVALFAGLIERFETEGPLS